MTPEALIEGVRGYWTRQWKIIDPTVEPLQIRRDADGRYSVEVHQVVKDLSGVVVADRDKGCAIFLSQTRWRNHPSRRLE